MGKTKNQDQLFNIQSKDMRLAFLQMKINIAVWNKLYRKDLIEENNIYLPEGVIYEDILFSELVKHYAKNIYILEEYLYRHIKRINSTSHDVINMQSKFDNMHVLRITMQELADRGFYQPFKKHYEYEYFVDYAGFVSYILKTYPIEPIIIQNLNNIKNEFVEIFPDFQESPTMCKIVSSRHEFLKLFCKGLSMSELDESYLNRLKNLLI